MRDASQSSVPGRRGKPLQAPVLLAGLTLVSVTVGGLTCRRTETSDPLQAPPPPAAEVAMAPGVPPAGVGMNGVTKPVMELMNEERAGRPGGTPTAEAVFAAAKQAGVPTSDPAQVLGRLLGASYCENARTARGIVLSVCEFRDAETLAKGRAYSEKTFAKPLPHRTLLANRKTLLTINPPDQTPSVASEVEAIAGAFARL